MSNNLLLIRGLPGSGKSTWAKSCKNYLHFEADMWFENRPGGYVANFSVDRLGEAHAWCFHATEQALRAGMNVVVSNTFTRLIEILPYEILAEQCGAELKIRCAAGMYESTHNVPADVMQRMKDRFEIWTPRQKP